MEYHPKEYRSSDAPKTSGEESIRGAAAYESIMIGESIFVTGANGVSIEYAITE